MKKLLLICFCIPLLMATTCEDDDDTLPGDNCTEEAVAGLNVVVTDAVTSAVLSDNVSVTAVDGGDTEMLELIPGSDPATFSGAWENPGTYVITITADGYQTFVSEPVSVSSNVCHVIPKNLSYSLTPQ